MSNKIKNRTEIILKTADFIFKNLVEQTEEYLKKEDVSKIDLKQTLRNIANNRKNEFAIQYHISDLAIKSFALYSSRKTWVDLKVEADSMLQIMKNKNSDYSWDKEFFGNFTVVEKLWITSAEEGFLVRMCDKVSRITNLLEEGREVKVLDEKVEDTLKDLVNYCVLLLLYIEDKNKGLVLTYKIWVLRGFK